MNELLPCPFCGADAMIIHHTKDILNGYQIVGCSNKESMLCPNPQIGVYADENGKYNYKWWNSRVNNERR